MDLVFVETESHLKNKSCNELLFVLSFADRYQNIPASKLVQEIWRIENLLQILDPYRKSSAIRGYVSDPIFLDFPFKLRGVFKKQLTDDGHSYIGAEIAAYKVSSLLKFDLVPLTIPYKFNDNNGSLQLFIDGGKFLEPSDLSNNQRQLAKQSLFDYIIDNEDRHDLNYFWIGERLISIDHGMSFHLPVNGQYYKSLNMRLGDIKKYYLATDEGKEMVNRLKNLDRQLVEKEIGNFVTPKEIEWMFSRIKLFLNKIE